MCVDVVCAVYMHMYIHTYVHVLGLFLYLTLIFFIYCYCVYAYHVCRGLNRFHGVHTEVRGKPLGPILPHKCGSQRSKLGCQAFEARALLAEASFLVLPT